MEQLYEAIGEALVVIAAPREELAEVREARHPELCRRPDRDDIARVRAYARAEGLWRFDER